MAVKITAEMLKGFVASLIQKDFDSAAETPECHMAWCELCCSLDTYVAIAAPRGHAKSTAITVCYTLANMLFRQRKFALIVSETEGQAILQLGEIKKHLTDNEDLRQLFGVKGFAKEAESDFICEFEDGEQFRITAKGAEQRVRGLRWNGARPDLIIGDDLEGDEQVLNKERRDKFRNWIYGALLPCKSDHGIVRIVGTILHSDSFLENLMPPEHGKYTIKQGLKTWSVDPRKKDTKSFTSVKYAAHNEDFTQILWPAKKSRETLIKDRQAMIDQGLSDVWSREMLNVPIDESRAFIKRSDLVPLQENEKSMPLNFYVGVDLAISEKQTADYSVFVIGGMDESRRFHVRDVIRERMAADELVAMFIFLQETYKPIAFVVEDGQIAKTLLPSLYEEMHRTGVYPDIHLVRASTDKVSRARPLQARVRAKAVKWDMEADWWPSMEDELLKFPRGKHDDQVDATSYMMLAVDRMVQAPTKEEQEEDDYQQEYERSGSGESGRSSTTGY